MQQGVSDKFERGDKLQLLERPISKLLDLQDPVSIIYVCLENLSCQVAHQLVDPSQGFEASNQTFIWVFKAEVKSSPNGYQKKILKTKSKEEG